MVLAIVAGAGALRERARRRRLAPLLAERARVERTAELGTPTIGRRFLAAGYLYGKDREIVVAPVDAPERARTLRVEVDLPVDPRPSPDGRWVALRGYASRDTRLVLADAASGVTRRAIEVAAGDRIEAPAWSPDGRHLAYVQRGDETAALAIVDPASGRGRVVASEAYAPIAWSPDGGRIAFQRGGVVLLADLAGAAGSEPRPVEGTSDVVGCLAWAPDGRQLAACRAETPECRRLWLHDLQTGAARRLDRGDCVRHLAWFPDSGAVAFAGRDRVRVARLAGGEPAALAGDPGLVKALGVTAAGAVLWASSSPDRPHAFWRHQVGGGAAVPVLESLAPDPRLRRPMERLAGAGAPVFRFPRTCGRADQPGPAVVWLPCGGIDGVPRWLQEVAWLSLHGMAVYMIDVATQLHDPPGLVARRIDEALAALDRIERQPDVRGGALHLLFCCGASELGYSVLVRRGERFRGAIDVHGTPGSAIRGPLDGVARLPPLLWMTMARDPAAASRDGLLDRLRRRGLEIEARGYDTNHWYQHAGARGRVLRDLTAFLRRSGEDACEDLL